MSSSTFNYSNLHFFDKSGTELMLKHTSTIKLDIPNSEYPQCGQSYILINGGDGLYQHSSLLKTKDGSRFPQKDNYKVILTVGDNEPIETMVPASYFDITNYSSSKGYIDADGNVIGTLETFIELTYNSLGDDEKRGFMEFIGLSDEDMKANESSFETDLVFDRVSTELVETQSIFVLTETEDAYNNVFGIHGLVDASTNASNNVPIENFVNEYNLFFFIDCRDQKDFRFFTVDGDSAVWSDRHIMNLSNGRMFISDNGYRVDIGFRGELEGVYDQKMYVCLMNKSTSNVTVIGTINMTAETEGEDERYKTFFTNFGLPSMDEFEPVFRDSDINDDYPDYISRNKHAKKIFLSYSEIFPFAGSYKALANAVNLLGYNDIFFKEWYKDIGKPTPDDDGYVAYDISFKSNPKMNTINSKPIEERIQLRKMNWLSMMYRLNEEVEGTVDKWGFPNTKDNINYYNTGNLAKLISLKEWLDKYIVGVNCRITDVGGEGIVFERYSMYKFGQFQQVFDYTNERPLSIKVNDEVEVLVDGSANLSVDVNTSNDYIRFEDLDGKSFLDFAEGVFCEYDYKDDPSTIKSAGDSSTNTYFGKTFEMYNHMDSFDVRTKGTHSTFKFNNSEFIREGYPQLIIDNDRIFFDPNDISKKIKSSVFDRNSMPVIKINRGYIKRYNPIEYNRGELYDMIAVHRYGNTTHIEDFNYQLDSSSSYDIDGDFTLVPSECSTKGILHLHRVEFKIRMSDPVIKNYRYIGAQFEIDPSTGSTGQSNDIIYDDTTLGLRFTSDTFDGTPAFMIAGYVSPQIKRQFGEFLPAQNETQNGDIYEYYLEILDGSMQFPDEANDRIVSVNFGYDGETRKIDITTFKTSRVSNIYEYETSNQPIEKIARFRTDQQYEYFVDNYRNDAESVVFMNKTKLINVENAGTYDLDVVISDESNNLFCSKANKSINIVTPDIDASLYTCDSSFISSTEKIGKEVGEENIPKINTITSSENNRCIYEYVPKKNIKSRNELDIEIGGYNSKSQNIDNGSEYYRQNLSFKYMQISNASERFVLVSSYFTEAGHGVSSKRVLCFIKRSYIDDSTGFVLMNDNNDVELVTMLQPNVNPDLLINSLLQKYDAASNPAINDEIGTLANVNVILYDDSCEYPMCSYPGICVPVKNYNGNTTYSNYEYRVIFDSVVTDQDTDEFINLASSPSISIYIIPAWSLECEVSGEDSIFIKGYDKLQYPFFKPLVKDDAYKLMFITNSDIPESPYNYEIDVRHTKDASYGELKSPKNTDAFGQSTYHLNLEQESAPQSFKSYWDKCLYLDSSINEGYIDNQSIKLFVSHAAKDYCEFILKADESETDYKNSILALDNTAVNREVSYYFDTTYTVSLRNFHVRNGIKYWDDDSSTYLDGMYSYNCNVLTNNPHIMVIPTLNNEFTHYSDGVDIVYNEEYTAYWKIYKQKNNCEHELLFECFNKILTLDLEEIGTYDIDMTIYDKHGNRFDRTFVGAITIKDNE